MKTLFQNYTFNAVAKTIRFNTTDTITLDEILLITNVTRNIIIYNFADPTKGGTIANNTLTLTYNTAVGMSNTDVLQIYIDNTYTNASEESLQYLKKIVQLLTPSATQDSAQRQRISLDSAPAVVTVTGTVTSNISSGTLTNVSQFGGVDPRFQFTDAARLTYAQGIRRNLIFS